MAGITITVTDTITKYNTHSNPALHLICKCKTAF